MQGVNRQNNNIVNNNTTQQAVPLAATSGFSSPWEEELDIPEENKKMPTIVGSLGPAEVPNIKTLKVPTEVEEKVGQEVNAKDVIGPVQVAAPQTPTSNKIPDTKINDIVTNKPQNNESVTATVVKPVQINGIQATPNQIKTSTPIISASTTSSLVPDNNRISDISTKPSISTESKPMIDVQLPNVVNSDSVNRPKPVLESIQPSSNNINSVPTDQPLEEIDWFGGITQEPIKSPETSNDQTNQKMVNGTETAMTDPITPDVPVSVTEDIVSDRIKPTIETETNIPRENEVLATAVKPVAQNANIEMSPEARDVNNKQISKAKTKLLNLNIGKILLSFLGSIILVLMMIIALNEFGVFSIGFDRVYGKIGLEKIWGGLSSNPSVALAQSFSKMKDHPDFKARGKIDLKVDTKLKTEISKPLISEDYGIENVNSDIIFYNSPEVSHAEVKITNNIGESTLQIQNKGDKLFVRGDERISYADDYGMWAEYVIGALSGKSFQNEIFNNKGEIKIDGKRVGVEKIEGKNSYHYQIDSISIGNSLESVGIGADMIQSIEGDIWLRVKDKLISKVALRITTPVSTAFSMIETNLTFYDYGVTNVIESIDENSIEDAEDRQSFSSASGDTKRKADVATIIKALEEYRVANGTFPSSNNQLIPLNTETNIVTEALIPQYIDEIPRDENDLFNWYYAYKSDGKKCSVSARLANSADPEAQLSGNLVLYIKYNSD